jgi:hypothetical protein
VQPQELLNTVTLHTGTDRNQTFAVFFVAYPAFIDNADRVRRSIMVVIQTLPTAAFARKPAPHGV